MQCCRFTSVQYSAGLHGYHTVQYSAVHSTAQCCWDNSVQCSVVGVPQYSAVQVYYMLAIPPGWPALIPGISLCKEQGWSPGVGVHRILG